MRPNTTVTPGIRNTDLDKENEDNGLGQCLCENVSHSDNEDNDGNVENNDDDNYHWDDTDDDDYFQNY